MKTTRYTEQQFKEAVESSHSIASVLKQLGLSPTGANYVGVKVRAERLKISLDHFTGQGHLKGKTHGWTPGKSLDEILVENSTYLSTHTLKRRLLRTGMLEYRCYGEGCGISEWKGRPIALQLEHCNGDKRDNRKENLTLLCPNCHSQTSTYAGKNKRRRGSPTAGGD